MQQTAPDLFNSIIDTDAILVQLIIELDAKILEIEAQFYYESKKQALQEIRCIKTLIAIAAERANILRDIIRNDQRCKIITIADLP